MSSFIKFLGTAGGRYVVARQLRASGGTYISANGQNIMLDPGPGALVKCAKSKPPIDATALNAIILSHLHIDHSNDVNILIDAVTGGGHRKGGVLFAPREALEGDDAVVFKYLRDFLEDIVVLEAERNYKIGDIEFSTSIKHQHTAETYGIKFNINGHNISFIADTRFFPELIDSYKGSDMLIVNVVSHTLPEKINIKHLCLDDVKEIIKKVKPSKAVITHFGMTMLKAKPWILAEQLSNELGIEITAASDGMTIEL
ncbi:MAG: MBL fold metallo-hydrolase [Nitrospirota bacterium]